MMAGQQVGNITRHELRKKRFASFHEMRNDRRLCDITINAGNLRFTAHRVILAAAIPYFRKAFTEGIECVFLPDIEPNIFQNLIDYAYTCILHINQQNVRSMLVGACYLGMDEVREACCDYLSANLKAEETSTVLELSLKFRCPKLLEDTDCYITENFDVISQTTDFLAYPLAYLKTLLEKDDLNVENEQQVVNAILRWVKASPEDRRDGLPELLGKVRMPLLEPRYLTSLVDTEEIIATSLPSRDLIDEARNYNLFPEMRRPFCSFEMHPRQHEWKTFVNPEEVVNPAIYQLHAQEIYSFYQFNLAKRKWSGPFSKICTMSTGSAVHLQNVMYYFRHYSTLYFNPSDGSSDFMRSMPTPREFTAATALESKIYVCGGATELWKASNAAECFDPEKNEWTTLRAMQTSRWGLNAVTCGDFIFALGGVENDKIHDTVERYDAQRNKWRSMSSMLCGRFLASAAALDGRIYVCGGLSSEVMASVERYNPIDDQWVFITPMSTTRHSFTLLPCRGMLLAIGGRDHKEEEVYDLDIYDPEKGDWILCCTSEHHRSSTSGAVIMSAVSHK